MHSDLHPAIVCGFFKIGEAIDLLVNCVDQDVLPSHAYTGLSTLPGSSPHDTGLDHVRVRTAVGMDIKGTLAVGNLARDDDSRIFGCRRQKT